MPGVFGEFLFGYVKEDYKLPDQETAIKVTAKWTCKPGVATQLKDLKYWWQRLDTDAYSIEKGLLRFEAYQVIGEDALIVHETFKDSDGSVYEKHFDPATTGRETSCTKQRTRP